MSEVTYQHGEPSWQDHASDDDTKPAAFYAELFGWEVPEGDQSMGGYRNCLLDGQMVAGVTPQMAPGVPPVWSTYINVDSAEAVAALVGENGGQVMVAPMEIAEYGTMAVFVDPTGAVIGVWQPGLHKGAQVRNVPGAVCWYELMTTDVDAASKFYSAVFGWTIGSHGPTDGPGAYYEAKVGDKMVAGILPKPPNVPAEVPSNWSVYFEVEDADATAAKITELGGKVLMGPTDMPPGRLAAVMDDSGAWFNIIKSSPRG